MLKTSLRRSRSVREFHKARCCCSWSKVELARGLSFDALHLAPSALCEPTRAFTCGSRERIFDIPRRAFLSFRLFRQPKKRNSGQIQEAEKCHWRERAAPLKNKPSNEARSGRRRSSNNQFAASDSSLGRGKSNCSAPIQIEQMLESAHSRASMPPNHQREHMPPFYLASFIAKNTFHCWRNRHRFMLLCILLFNPSSPRDI